MAGEENLIPFDKLTEDEQRKIASQGGRASGEARRRQKQFKDDCALFLDALANRKDAQMTNQAAIIAAIGARALRGDVKAFEALRDTVGEKPAQAVQLSTPDGPLEVTELRGLSTDELLRQREALKNRPE